MSPNPFVRALAALPLIIYAHSVMPAGAFAAIDSIALACEIVPDTGGGTFGFFGQPDLNDDGEVVFFGTIASGTSSQGIFVGDGTTVRNLALDTTIAPGGAGTFPGFFFFFGQNR